MKAFNYTRTGNVIMTSLAVQAIGIGALVIVAWLFRSAGWAIVAGCVGIVVGFAFHDMIGERVERVLGSRHEP